MIFYGKKKISVKCCLNKSKRLLFSNNERMSLMHNCELALDTRGRCFSFLLFYTLWL